MKKIIAAGVLFLLLTGTVFGIDPQTQLAMRLWAPEDIEAYAREIAANRVTIHEDDRVTNAILKFQKDTGIDLGWAPQTREDVVMRRVAYGVLKYWPASMRAVQAATAGEQLTHYHHTVFGKDMLVDYWRMWSAAWHRLWKDAVVFADSDIKRAMIAEFEKVWGKWDSVDPPRKIPQGYLPEETDGIWYLQVKSKDKYLLHGVMEKRGGFFDKWDNKNTHVVSYYSLYTNEAAAPFPDMVQFAFASNGQLKMMTDAYSNLSKEPIFNSRGFVNVDWTPGVIWSSGTPLSFEAGYPVLNLNKGFHWDYLPLKVSAVKFDDWDNSLDHLYDLQMMSREQIGALMQARKLLNK